jgi:hypothetical protein
MSENETADVDLRAAVAGWVRAEEMLTGTLRIDPVTYEAALAAVGRVLTILRASITDLDGLRAAEHDPDVIAVARHGLPGLVEPSTAVAAALAIRYRELAYQAQLDRRRAAIEDARRAGSTWVRLDEPGPGGAVAPGPPAELRVHVASGLAVSATTEFHLDTGSTLFVARPVLVDLKTGAITGEADELGEERVAWDRDELEEQMGEIAAAIERLTGPRGSDKR